MMKTLVSRKNSTKIKHKMHECDLELNNDILTSISCPACKEHLTIPVYLCRLGHSVCGSCRRRLARCPICAQCFINGSHTRNWTLEGIIELLLYPCPNQEFGCQFSCKLDELKWHTETCPYRVYACHITDGTKCSWYGRSCELQNHVYNGHSLSARMENGDLRTWVQETCNVESQMLFENDNKFWVHRKQQDGLLCWSIQYIGPQEECVNYCFTLTVLNSDPPNLEDTSSSFKRILPMSNEPRKISLHAGVQPDALSPQELFQDPFRYVCLSVRVFKMYQNYEDTITYRIMIYEKEENLTIEEY